MFAGGATVTLGDNARAIVIGGGENVVMGSGGILELRVGDHNTVTTQGTNDTITADHPTTISLAGSATITGSLDTVTMAGDGQSLTVMGSNNSISTTGTNDTVTLFGVANALTTSGATSIDLSGPNGTATVNGTGDSLALSGTGESVTFNGGNNSATITGDADSVQSVGGTVAVTMGLSGRGQITVNNSLITTNDNSETSVIGSNDQVATSAASGGFTTLNVNGVGDSVTVTDFGFTTSEQMLLANGASGGTSPVNDLFLGTGVGDLDHHDIWLQASGNDLVIERLGSHDSVTVSNWFAGAGNQLSAIHAGDGAELLNAQVAQLVQGMASFQAANPGFDPTAAGASQVAQNDPGLQTTIAAAWHP